MPLCGTEGKGVAVYFPDNMTWQYFFLDTYPGYFLQLLPLALLAGAVYAALRLRREGSGETKRVLLGSLFVCYLAGLLGVTLLLRPISMGWYRLLYHRESGMSIHWFGGGFDLALGLDFGAENLFNLLLFLPFGFLYPLFRRGADWRRTALTGLGLCLGIELLQPVFGRSFDLNDILLNGIGIMASTALCFGVRRWRERRRPC